VPPEHGRLTPETYRGLRHNKSVCDSESVLSWLRYCEILQYMQFPQLHSLHTLHLP
jgi:hypothetical protein